MLQPLVKPTSNRYSVSSTPAPSDPLSVSTPSVAPSNPLETPISPRSSEPPQEKLNAGTTSAVTGTIGSLYEFASPKITKIGLFGSGRAEMDRNVQVQVWESYLFLQFLKPKAILFIFFSFSLSLIVKLKTIGTTSSLCSYPT